MTKRLTGALAAMLALGLLLFGFGSATTASAKPRTVDPAAVAVTGTVADDPATTVDETGRFAGTFDVTRFAVVDGELTAIGTLTGAITNTATGVVSQVPSTQIQLPVDVAQSHGTCEILNLVLGPLDLDLLGLQVHLDQVTLIIEAESGPGNLLGNLLCAIAGLLDANTGLSAILNQIANLLNQLLGILR